MAGIVEGKSEEEDDRYATVEAMPVEGSSEAVAAGSKSPANSSPSSSSASSSTKGTARRTKSVKEAWKAVFLSPDCPECAGAQGINHIQKLLGEALA